MEEWTEIDGTLHRVTSFWVRGRVIGPSAQSDEIDFIAHRAEDGGPAVRLEATVSRAAWARVETIDRRLLEFQGRNGSEGWTSDDVIVSGLRGEGPLTCRVELTLNHLTTRTEVKSGFPTPYRSVQFAEVQLFEGRPRGTPPTVHYSPIRIRAEGWGFVLSRQQTPEDGHHARRIAGRVVTVRTYARIEAPLLDEQTPAAARTALRHRADALSGLLSCFAMESRPWLAIDACVGQVAETTTRPAKLAPRERPPLVDSLTAPEALRAGTRTQLRLERKDDPAAAVLLRAMHQFAFACTAPLDQSWRWLTVALDVLGCVDRFSMLDASRHRRFRAVSRRLIALAESAGGKGRRGPVRDDLVALLRGQAASVLRPSYRTGIQGLIDRQQIDSKDLGGEDLVRDIVDIRHALAHDGSLSLPRAKGIAKRSKDPVEQAWVGASAAAQHRAMQMMLDRHSKALCLLARILLRILRVPDRCAPRAWRQPEDFRRP